ncbi:MAG TPA: FemAB, partial [Sphingopyxis sp.]|nr:FemAB [Sphingopyxis sp.]
MAGGGVNAPAHPVAAPVNDAAAWDAYVAAHPAATPFHSRAWCEAVTAATGHKCHFVAARDAAGRI